MSTGANLNQAAFSGNWKAGGSNSIALGLFLNARANYKRAKISWDNDLQLQYGVVKNAGEDLRKSVDAIFLDTKYGYATSSHWNLFVAANFISQFGKGYNYDVDADGTDELISNFMAPGFFTLSTGFEYKPKPWFSIRFSPLSPRLTFLLDEEVGLVERYGVPEGKQVRTEWFAALIQADIDKDIATNLNLKASYRGFSNYEDISWKTFDHRLVTSLSAKVNRFLSVNVAGIVLYDRDQDAKVQYSQSLALGVLYKLQNFKEKEKK